jgi:hypothetical protein
MDVYDWNSKHVNSKRWNNSGRNLTTFYLPKGRYTVEVPDCKNRFNINLNVKSMSLTIRNDCTSTEYRENE